jgi:hypothetical protein
MRLTVGYDYVLILEWLGPDDRRTGTQLHARLLERGMRSHLVICNSGEDVRNALINALDNIRTEGVPAIHLETHGSNPFENEPEEIAFGVGRDQLIGWNTLGEWLAPLNVASGFQLLVVSGACWGSGVIQGIGGGEHPAPFACAIGFRTEVFEGTLYESIRELYRSLSAGVELEESVANAQRELVAGQEIHLEIAVVLAVKMLRRIFFGPPLVPRIGFIGSARRRRRARQVWNTWFPPPLQEAQPVYRFENAQIEV